MGNNFALFITKSKSHHDYDAISVTIRFQALGLAYTRRDEKSDDSAESVQMSACAGCCLNFSGMIFLPHVLTVFLLLHGRVNSDANNAIPINDEDIPEILERFEHHYENSDILNLQFPVDDVTSNTDSAPIVDTQFGPVAGKYVSPDPKTNTRQSFTSLPQAYLGIPFAQPPLGNKRFTKPERWNQTWKEAYGRETLNAQHLSPQCPQVLLRGGESEMSEDCLYLNVYTPSRERLQQLRDAGIKRLPVMLWLFGGAFVFGGAGSGQLNSVNNLYIGNYVVHNKGKLRYSYLR